MGGELCWLTIETIPNSFLLSLHNKKVPVQRIMMEYHSRVCEEKSSQVRAACLPWDTVGWCSINIPSSKEVHRYEGLSISLGCFAGDDTARQRAASDSFRHFFNCDDVNMLGRIEHEFVLLKLGNQEKSQLEAEECLSQDPIIENARFLQTNLR